MLLLLNLKKTEWGDLSVAYHHSPVLNCEVSQISMKFIDYGNKQFSKVFLTLFFFFLYIYIYKDLYMINHPTPSTVWHHIFIQIDICMCVCIAMHTFYNMYNILFAKTNIESLFAWIYNRLTHLYGRTTVGGAHDSKLYDANFWGGLIVTCQMQNILDIVTFGASLIVLHFLCQFDCILVVICLSAMYSLTN